MSLSDVKQITFRQYVNAIRSYRNEEETKQREAWERARFVRFYGLPRGNKHFKIDRMTDLILFDWEKEPKPIKLEFTQRQLDILKKWG